MIPNSLIAKYNIPVPRYTSYPPASVWESMEPKDFRAALSGLSSASLYVHIPFCRSICAYCGCSSLSGQKPGVEAEYVSAIMQESALIASCTGRLSISQLHFGGGTPTKLAAHQLSAILNAIRSVFSLDGEISMEIDPRTIVGSSLLEDLKALGITRVSLGIQDFDGQVQKAIGRHQSEQVSREAIERCLSLGFSSVNLDLVYGLPCQTIESFQATIDKAAAFRPHRIALFSFAFLPEIRANQRALQKELLPTPEEKFRMFLHASERLIRSGYVAIGLDHFALPEDALCTSLGTGTLRRSFQGYTDQTGESIGLGMTSISAVGNSYFQNAKSLPEYLKAIVNGRLATRRGAHATPDDLKRQRVIEQIMCQGRCRKADFESRWNEPFDQYFHSSLDRLVPMIHDGLVECTKREIIVTNTGRFFLRPIAACFDATLPPTASYSI